MKTLLTVGVAVSLGLLTCSVYAGTNIQEQCPLSNKLTFSLAPYLPEQGTVRGTRNNIEFKNVKNANTGNPYVTRPDSIKNGYIQRVMFNGGDSKDGTITCHYTYPKYIHHLVHLKLQGKK